MLYRLVAFPHRVAVEKGGRTGWPGLNLRKNVRDEVFLIAYLNSVIKNMMKSYPGTKYISVLRWVSGARTNRVSKVT